MRLSNKVLSLKLNYSSIDTASEEIQNFLMELKTPKKEMTRIRLSAEEVLLVWLKEIGEDIEFTLKLGTRLTKPRIVLEIKGMQVDPFLASDSDEQIMPRLLSGTGMAPVYSYSRSKNVVVFTLKKKKQNPVIKILIALAAAIVVGLLGGFLPEVFRANAVDYFLNPIYSSFLGILSAISGPMIFMSVLVGVCDIGDTATLGKMGKKLISRFLVVLLIVSLFSTIIVFPLAGLKISSELSGNHNFFDIFQMLLNILPKNVADAFLSGNTMQIIVIALACGVALLIMESKAQPVISIAEQINSMIYIIMEWISSLVPILIFVVILSNIWSGSVDTIIQIWKPLVTIITLFYIVMCIYFVYVSLRLKISVVSLIKKIMPSYIIALTTASSTAAFGETKNCCEKRIGIESTFVKFAIPLGIVAFKPGTVICYVVLSMFSAAIYGVEISVGWLVMLVIIAVILSVATPPVLGGALTAFTMLFLQLGIPVEALVMVMTIDVIVDFFSTGMNMAMVQADLAVQAKKLDILNKNILHKQP